MEARVSKVWASRVCRHLRRLCVMLFMQQPGKGSVVCHLISIKLFDGRRKYMMRKIIAGTALLLWMIGGSAFVQSYDLPKSVARGKELYVTYCQNCHMADGK